MNVNFDLTSFILTDDLFLIKNDDLLLQNQSLLKKLTKDEKQDVKLLLKFPTMIPKIMETKKDILIKEKIDIENKTRKDIKKKIAENEKQIQNLVNKRSIELDNPETSDETSDKKIQKKKTLVIPLPEVLNFAMANKKKLSPDEFFGFTHPKHGIIHLLEKDVNDLIETFIQDSFKSGTESHRMAILNSSNFRIDQSSPKV